MEYCKNYGNVTNKMINGIITIGGLVAYPTQNHQIKYCENYGDVTSATVHTGSSGIGGLFGGKGNVAITSYEGCAANCKVTAPEGSTSVGILMGYCAGQSGRTIVMGSETDPIKVAGIITVGDKSTELTEENYKNYLYGSALSAADLTIYSAYNTANKK